MKVFNKTYRREYSLIEKYEAGVALSGAEVKSAKQGRIKLAGSFVKIRGSEAYLVNAEISIYQYARPEGYDPARTRKLLLHKKEIIRLKTKLKTGGNLTVVPVSCYNKKGLIKLEIALSKGKKTWERKKFEKEEELKRQAEKEIKEEIKIRG